ncbi:rhomboid family intramembrane serine protease [Rothia sp. 88186D007BW]
MSEQVGRYGYSSDEVPVCPRHPNQVTYVRCGRCNRLACGQCQIPLEVGMMCVDCMAAAQRSAPRPSYAKARPTLTYALIAINSVVWVLQLLFPQVTMWGIYNPLYVEYSGQWYRMLSAGFLHAPSNITHLLLNMFTLYLFGQMLEPLMGRWKFLATYLFSIVGGSVAVHLLASVVGGMSVSTLGASGGVFGLFGAYFSLARARRQSTNGIVVLVAINFVFGFIMPGISWEAHLGGLVTGALVATILDRLPSKPGRF